MSCSARRRIISDSYFELLFGIFQPYKFEDVVVLLDGTFKGQLREMVFDHIITSKVQVKEKK